MSEACAPYRSLDEWRRWRNEKAGAMAISDATLEEVEFLISMHCVRSLPSSEDAYDYAYHVERMRYFKSIRDAMLKRTAKEEEIT